MPHGRNGRALNRQRVGEEILHDEARPWLENYKTSPTSSNSIDVNHRV